SSRRAPQEPLQAASVHVTCPLPRAEVQDVVVGGERTHVPSQLRAKGSLDYDVVLENHSVRNTAVQDSPIRLNGLRRHLDYRAPELPVRSVPKIAERSPHAVANRSGEGSYMAARWT